MHKTFAVIRTFAALALVLALVAGLFAPRAYAQDASVEPSTEPAVVPVESTEPEAPVEPAASASDVVETPVEDGAIDGDAGANPGTDNGGEGGNPTAQINIADNVVELRARVQGNDGEGVGTTVFVYNEVIGAEAGASEPLGGATFQVVDDTTGTIIDTVTTDANGSALLDVTVAPGTFSVLDLETGDQITGLNYTLGQPRPVLTATRIVSAGGSGTVEDGSDLYTVAADQIELRARIEESSTNDAGVTFFLGADGDEITDLALGDSTPGAGLTFQVITVTETPPVGAIPVGELAVINVVDEATTGADGVVLLSVPLDVEYVIREIPSGDQTVPLITTAAEVQAGREVISATKTVSVPGGDGGNTGPTGDSLPYAVATDQIELRARFAENPALSGTTVYTLGDVETLDFTPGESTVAAGVTFSVLDEVGRVVSQGITNELGEVLLSVPVDANATADDPTTPDVDESIGSDSTADFFTIINDFNTSESQQFFSPTAGEVQAGRLVVTAAIRVEDIDGIINGGSASSSAISSASGSASSSASGSASSSASASASPSPAFDGPVVEDGVTITGLVKVDDVRAGQYDYFAQVDEVTTLADEPVSDTRTAFAGEQTYEVYAIVDGESVLVDRGDTDANGMVVLDIPVEFDYYITEINDPIGGPTVDAGLETAFVVIEYVATAAASTSPSAVASAAASVTASAAASGTGGATALPNTGAGSSDMGSSMTWALFALLAVAGVAAAGFGLRRRNV